MKQILLFACLFISLFAVAQYSSPESVEFDAPRNRYIVASTSNGNLYSVVPGSAPVLFTSAVNSPYGICIVGDSIYVCDQSSYIKVFNLVTGAAAGSINTGGTFLNGICTDFAGNIYATDFSGKKIYRMSIATQQFNVYVAATVKTPNGIVYDPFHNRLVVCSWGTNAPLLGVNMSDSSIATIKTTTLSNIDGVTIDEDGNLYCSAWGTQSVYFFDSSLVNAPLQIVIGLSNPADISYNVTRDTLAVPNSGNANTVTFYGFPRPVAVNDVDTVCVDSAKNICVLANDFAANNTPLILSDHTFPVNGTLNIQANCLQYQALTAGTETVTYTVCTNDTPSFCKTATLEIFNKTCAAQQLLPIADFNFNSVQFTEPCTAIFSNDLIELVNTSQNADSSVWTITQINGSCPDSIFVSNQDSVTVQAGSIWFGCAFYQSLEVCLTAFNSVGSNTKCDTTCNISWESITELPLADIYIYPNPATDVVTINMQNNTGELTRNYKQMDIMNAVGQIVKSVLRKDELRVVQIDIADLPAGVYTATIVSAKNERRSLGRFSIQR